MTGLKRNRKRHSHPTSTATMPMCSPEMLMRWFSPNGRNAALSAQTENGQRSLEAWIKNLPAAK